MVAYIFNCMAMFKSAASFVIAIAPLMAVNLVSANAETGVYGVPVVVDGDTLKIGGERVRLHGIDAPETTQTCIKNQTIWKCGRQAGEALKSHIDGREVACEGDSRDRYGRLIAVCSLAGKDLNAWIVREGWAMAYRRYSTDYVDEEQEAAARGAGIWAGDFVSPWEWRRARR